MTRDNIIKAAFKVWGRDLYRTTSLTELARELGVSKPALYRHFKDKKALSDAMFTAYFEDFAAFVKGGYDRAISAENRQEGCLLMIRTMTEYYVRNREAFVFSLIQVFNSRDRKTIQNEYRIRGIDFERLVDRESGDTIYPSRMHLIMITLIFCIAHFHHTDKEFGKNPSDDLVKRTLALIENRITKGLGLDAGKAYNLDYERLEQQAARKVYEDTENNALLRAVAEAVAEAGPWNASMEMVARRSGLSKSGLYAHFKNKQDMLAQLFMTEFTRLLNYTRLQVETTEEGEEQLYLAIITIVDYLRSRPEILVAMEWIKTRRLDLGDEAFKQLYKTIGEIKLKAVRNQDRHFLVWIANWILFMIVNVLAWWPPTENRPDWSKVWAKNIAKIPNESFRLLFRFIALGSEGLN